MNYWWLNKDSRDTLANGYLLEGETAEQRIEDIANAAQGYLNNLFKGKDMPEWASNFKKDFLHGMARGWYSLASPIWSNFGRDRGLPISCVTGDTWINTLDNGGKQAKDIQEGDMVLTHKGRYRQVTKVIKTEEREGLYTLKVRSRMTPIKLTGDHLVYTNYGWVRTDELDPKVHLVAVNGDIELPSAPHVIELSNPDPNVDSQYQRTQVPSRVPVDVDLAWALGLWFAEGSLTRNGSNYSGIRITLDDTDEEKAAGERWLNIMSSAFGVNGNIYFSSNATKGKEATWQTVNLNSATLGEYFSSFGVGAKVKTLPQWVLELPEAEAQAFLDGILFGDGSITTSSAVKLTLANPQLLLQIYQLALKLGHDVSLQMQDKAGKLSTTKHVYTLMFRRYRVTSNRHTGYAGIRFHDGLVYSPIASLEPLDGTYTVYDFTVEEDHSFSAAGAILHNCFGSYVHDSMDGILTTAHEIGMMSKYGGGTSAYFGDVRGRGAPIQNGDNGYSEGAVNFMRLYDTLLDVTKQGSTRRGHCAVYLPIDHPDIEEFLTIRRKDSVIQQLSFAVIIPEGWMEEMLAGDNEKRRLWLKVLERRSDNGMPYIFFADNANGPTSPYHGSDYKILASNMCSEIMLPSSDAESFVCCLASMNVAMWDEWRGTNAVEVLTVFLDMVMEEFIVKSKHLPGLERAHRFSVRHRAIGIGQLGYHTYLQANMIAFGSLQANAVTGRVTSYIQNRSHRMSEVMGRDLGVPEVAQELGLTRRNTTTTAIAPTASSSFILGQVSAGIEPIFSNYYIEGKAKTTTVFRNPHLVPHLQAAGLDTTDVWAGIMVRDGSVQHLDLPADVKEVFKTFSELSQADVLTQAQIRQRFLDQGQSLNVMIHPDTPVKDRHEFYVEAWKRGIKAMYYEHSTSAAQEFNRELLDCSTCSA